MLIAIHHSEISYSSKWIDYCEKNNIRYKIVNCYNNDIIDQLADCDALLWHYHHKNRKDILFAKQLLYALENSGKIVFPDFNTGWHFDDKVGQKYLLESISAPLIDSYVFFDRKEARQWVKNEVFPKVFKLRSGSASSNVRLVRSKKSAVRLINRSFRRGFSQFNSVGGLADRIRLFRDNKMPFMDIIEGVGRLFIIPHYARVKGRERGYIYFQDYIPGNTHDIRVNYVYGKCFASRRGVRPGDFRASGSWIVDLDMANVPEEAIRISFDVASRLKLQTVALDFVMKGDEPRIVEVSYGFAFPKEQFKKGFWDKEMNYHPGEFDPFGWIVQGVIEQVKMKRN